VSTYDLICRSLRRGGRLSGGARRGVGLLLTDEPLALGTNDAQERPGADSRTDG
jgi:hypothetical protein